jgi:hypothetical protein
MKNTDLYLDLDGVILRRTGSIDIRGRTEFAVAPRAMDFLSWAIESFNCYWLTSRSHDGSYNEIERAFRFAIPANSLPVEIKDLIRAIGPAAWGVEKVSGIDLLREFYWVDDNPDDGSVNTLEKTGLTSHLIIASTDQRQAELDRVGEFLGEVSSAS